MVLQKEKVGLSDEERRSRLSELQRLQEEKESKMRALQAEFHADRTIVRPPPTAFLPKNQHACTGGSALGGAARTEMSQTSQETSPHATPEYLAAAATEVPGCCEPVTSKTGDTPPAPAGETPAARAAAARSAAVHPAVTTTPSSHATKKPKELVTLPPPQQPQFQEGGISEEERQRRAAGIRRQQAEREQARRNIAQEFRADHNFRAIDSVEGEGLSATLTTSAPVIAAAAAAASAVSSMDTCMVQIRLPDGEMKQQLFQASDILALVTDWAHNLLRQQGIYESCKLVLPPRQVLAADAAGKSLRELQFLPRVSLNVQLQSSDGRVTSAPRAGAEFEAAFVDELTRMLESEGCTAWEASQWATLVEGQLRRGEMRRVRASVRALFGGLRLPTTIGAWAARVDLAPSIPEPPKSADAAVRFRAELSACTSAEKEVLGFEMLPLPRAADSAPSQTPTPAPRLSTLIISKLAPASALARELAALCETSRSLPNQLVLQVHFGPEFPFEAPAIRVVYPILAHIPLSTPCAAGAGGDCGPHPPRASVGMALQANAGAVALDGARCGKWSMNMGQSFPRFACWLRNWLIASGAHVDSPLSQSFAAEGGSAGQWHLRTVGGVWETLRVVVEEGGGCGEWIALPPALRVVSATKEDVSRVGRPDQDMGMLDAVGLVDEKEENDTRLAEAVPFDDEEEEEKDPGVQEMMNRGLWVMEEVLFAEVSTRGDWTDGGGRMTVASVSSWQAGAGTIVVSSRVAARLGIGSRMDGGYGDGELMVEVRGVKVREATRVACKAASDANVNTLHYNLHEIQSALVKSKATCCSGQSMSVSLGCGREILVYIVEVWPVDYSYLSANTLLTVVS